jgi:hypothetical protein
VTVYISSRLSGIRDNFSVFSRHLGQAIRNTIVFP